jgi:hypothetical protein
MIRLSDPMSSKLEIRKRLTSDVVSAKERFRQAQAEFKLLVDDFPSRLPPTDGALVVRKAGQTEQQARKALTIAVKRLSDFATRGIEPDDLQERTTRSASA